ncbi:conserved hypothetical protein [Verticillium alfalfae VaMs.102]|uniref:Uncharacterized protein n=1 Tax=Verticillium alfalfae (strain VaMs.102 / ATCC MYA-4576 / FGSC 10136) TaxID=526221 RepID=C9SVJ0_VERA1|nr:conserved hypothetical protein [Verticillium alfalfae VaMs.102]EEY22805.1 conserved hypothetical protein [Verticillium alfalfae VaMs.102]
MTALSQSEKQYRQLARNISRSGLGVFISGILSIKLPWLLMSGVYNACDLARNIKLLRDLKRALKSAGIRIKKRIIARGLIEGAATKLMTTVLTLGHDEVGAGSMAVASWLRHAGSFMAEHATIFSFSSPISTCSVLDWDSEHRLNHSLLENTTDIASRPVSVTQEVLGLDGGAASGEPAGKECVEDEHQWEESGAVVAEQVLIVGAVQLGTEKLIDVVLEKPYDRAVDYEYRRTRDKIKA